MTTTTIPGQHPVLVYGTLRPGQGNYYNFLNGETISEEDVTLKGFAMYSNGGFPYLVDGDRDVVATLVHIKPESYIEVMRGLDYLEGYRPEDRYGNHYDRRLLTFEKDGEQVQAWIYIAGATLAQEVSRDLPLVESGDWAAFQASKQNSWNRYYHGMR